MTAARRERDLNEDQNERVRTLVRELLKREGETQVSLAPKLGLKQPALSGFLGRRQGTSYSTARRAAQLAGLDVDEVLEGRATKPDPYPARSKALALAGPDIHPDALNAIRNLQPTNAADLTPLDWMRMIVAWDDLARRGALP